MKRIPRYCPQDMPVHVIQRGNNRSPCFAADQDMATYIKYLLAASVKYEISVHAWVLMTNHVHLLVTPGSDNGVSRMMQYLGRLYVRYFNRKYERTGTLWEGRFKSCLIRCETYFLVCQRYIELNPVRAGMVERPDDYRWSSYGINALGRRSALCSPHPVYLALGNNAISQRKAYRELFAEQLPSSQIEALRYAISKGGVLGPAGFVDKKIRNYAEAC